MIIVMLSILVLQIPMIYAQPDQTDRFHKGLLWKKSWYPIQKYIFAVRAPESASYSTTERYDIHCEAKNATRILACKTDLTKAVHLLQAK